MKTWEILKLLTENQEIRFRRAGKDLTYYYNGISVMCSDGITTAQSGDILNLKAEWELIPQEVTWREAIQAWVDGKTVYCKVEACYSPNGMAMRFIFDESSHESRYPLDKAEILKGKWFIE